MLGIMKNSVKGLVDKTENIFSTVEQKDKERKTERKKAPED